MIDGIFVIDAHNHINPGIRKEYYGVDVGYFQTADQLVNRMNTNGIDMAVVMSSGSGLLSIDHLRRANEYVAESIKKHPNRLIGWCIVSPLLGEWMIEELKRYVSTLGFKGIKLLPHLHGFYPVDSEIVHPFIEEAAKLKIPVTIHSDFNNKRCTPYQVVSLAERFPEVTFLMAHMGMDPDQIHWIPSIVKKAKNVYLETSCTPNLPKSVYVNPCRILGPERVIFGSDSPSLSPEVELKKVEIAEKIYGLTKYEKELILGKNIAEILKIKISPSHSESS